MFLLFIEKLITLKVMLATRERPVHLDSSVAESVMMR